MDEDHTRYIWGKISQALRQRPLLSGSQWADNSYILSPESSATPGKWETYPWQREILDAMTDYGTKFVIIKKPTRVGFTKMISISHAYFIDQRPSVQLHYQPNADEARGYAEDEFETMVRDNQRIADLIETPNTRGRTKKEKTVKKLYPGGYIEILGAESDRNMNRRTARVAVGDEIDTWKREAGKAGDALTTMFRRTSDFWDRKNIIGGKVIGAAYNPEIEELDGVSMIDYWFQRGTQEYRHWPCPHCGEFQRLEFEDMLWDKDTDEITGKTIKHYPDTAHFICKSCGERIEDKHKREMDKKAKWVAQNPDALKNGIRSFHPWAILSYSPNMRWPDIVREYIDAMKDPLSMKAFYSEVLARPWEDEVDKIDVSTLSQHKEEYTADVPSNVVVLTFGADIQKDRIEWEVVGWCRGYETYSIERGIFIGDPLRDEVWRLVEAQTLKEYYHESGDMMSVYAAGVDEGYLTSRVHDFCRPRFAKNVFSVKGASTMNADVVKRTAVGKYGFTRLMMGSNKCKDDLSVFLSIEAPGAGYMHFPDNDTYNDAYFKQFGAEYRSKTGRWQKMNSSARNEAIDIRNLNYAVLKATIPDLELIAQRGPLTNNANKAPRAGRRVISKGVRR